MNIVVSNHHFRYFKTIKPVREAALQNKALRKLSALSHCFAVNINISLTVLTLLGGIL